MLQTNFREIFKNRLNIKTSISQNSKNGDTPLQHRNNGIECSIVINEGIEVACFFA